MRLAVRRAVGITGATAVAIGAALTLALPASAHVPHITAGCNDNKAELTITLQAYGTSPSSKGNWVEASDENGQILAKTSFGSDFTKTIWEADATVAHHYTVTVYAQDDANGSQHGNGSRDQWDGTFSASSNACCPGKTTTTTPPTTTTGPPTTTTHTTTPPSTTTGSTTSTTTAVVAAATSTGPVGSANSSLPFTGANVGLPLGIAGALVVIGGGLLFWLRFNAKRRSAS